MRKWISSVVFVVCCLAIMGFLWPSGTSAQSKTMNLYIWSEYIDPQIIKDFEKETGNKVVVTLYESNEDMVAKLQGGGTSQYDVVVPTDYIVPNMLELKLLQPLKKDLISNIKNLDPKFAKPNFDPENTYTVPYQWGTMALGYRTDKLKEGFEETWGLIFDPKLQQGPFVLIDDQRPMIGAAALYLGFDMNTTKTDELKKIQEVLLETKKRSAGFIGGVGGKNQLLAGTANVAVVYNGDAIRATEENPKIGYFIPKEGANIWMDNMAIPVEAPHAELGNQFINYILDAKVGAQLSNFNRYATPNLASRKLINPEDLKEPAIYPDEATTQTLQLTKVLKGDEMRLIDALWTNVKSG